MSDFGAKGQVKLLEGSALVVGCGALGSLVAVQLAAAGVGRIGIADYDTVDLSNLQRQLFFTEADCGKRKSSLILKAIEERNRDTMVEEHQMLVTEQVARRIFRSYDVVIDGSDNPATKGMTSRVCDELGIPCVIGGVEALSGMILTQTYASAPGGPALDGHHASAPGGPALDGHHASAPGGPPLDGHHKTWASLFPNDYSDDPTFSPCSLAGVLGPVPGVIASLQSLEAIKILARVGEPLASRLLIFDGLNSTFREIQL